MFRHIILLSTVFAITSVTQAQKSEGGKPLSGSILTLKKSAVILPVAELKSKEFDMLLKKAQTNPGPILYGIYTDTLIHLKDVSRKDVIPGKGNIWRFKIAGSNASSVQVAFKKFFIPDGSKLYIYNEGQTEVAGAYTNKNMQPDSSFTMGELKGNHVIIEYFEPENAKFNGQLIIGAIGQGYNNPLETESALGFININCPVGKNAQLAKHAVCKMTFKTGIYMATCTGALINNVRNDGTPYFLTAHHCISSQTEASSLIVYFNYEVVGCSGDTLKPKTLSGSDLLSTGQPSDYTLLKLRQIPTPEYQPFFAGWDINDVPASMVTGVHTPYLHTKKISIDEDTVVSNEIRVTWEDESISPVGSHWIAQFDKGLTSQGSSGSPLFNQKNQILGQLHGGDEVNEFYGKLSYAATHKPSLYPSIMTYLDPDATGKKTMDGFAPLTNIPDAFFSSSFEQVCYDTPVQFTDYSVFGPYTRHWTITPATYTFMDQTSDTSANPVIAFSDDTTYTVNLDLLTEGTIKSSEKIGIKSGNVLFVNVESDAPDILCDCDFSQIKLTASGAGNYEWRILPEDILKVGLTRTTGDTVTIYRLPAFKPGSNYSFAYEIIGTQQSCTDTSELGFEVLKPANDNVSNAILLGYGKSDMFTNICASVEEGEPVPPFTSCTSQDAWCDEYGTGNNIVENSVWFKFVAGNTGRISISSGGFDNQIALYDAASADEILNGNYVILGANDDRTDTDFKPYLKSEVVTPGKMYWLQVDGSGGGLEDYFYISINELQPLATDDQPSIQALTYPVPANQVVYIQHSDWKESQAEVIVFNTSGICIFNQPVSVSAGLLKIDVSSWQPGIYFAQVKMNDSIFISKIMKK